MKPLMKEVDVVIANEEDLQSVLGIPVAGSDVTGAALDVSGYRAAAERVSRELGPPMVAVTLRESVSASDNGWSAQGFVRIGNSLPERWYVALIENGAAPRVEQMAVTSTGSGTLDIPGLGQGKTIRDATLVIAPMAPKTTETADYSVSIRKK